MIKIRPVLPILCNKIVFASDKITFKTYWDIRGGLKMKSTRRKPVKIAYELEEDAAPVALASKPYDRPPKTVTEKDAKLTAKVAEDSQCESKQEKSDVVRTVEPANWAQVFENIREMRKDNPAPVDTMGCERSMEDNVEPKVKRYQTLISLLLSSQTKDEVNYAAMGRLKEYGLNPQKMLEIPEDELKGLIKPVSFYNNKAANIKKASQILQDKYDGDIPNTAEALMELPGIGPKMSYICMQVAWGVNEGIGVDTHVHRISERLGWTTKKGKRHTPEDTRKQLESWLPKELWQEVNIILVGFGQTICNPIKPKCSECLNKEICPFGRQNIKAKKPKGK